MTSTAWALQQAVFAALLADEAVAGLVANRIFDAVPRGSAFPYIVIGDGGEIAGGEETEHTLAIRIWSRGGGHRETKEIATAVHAALAALTLDDPALIDFRFASADYVRAGDGETWRATLRFKAVTETRT